MSKDLMKVTIKDFNHTGKIAQNRKEKHFCQQFTMIDTLFNEIAVLRIYNTQATTYACVWVNSSSARVHVAGGAKSSGYGYHRASDAAQNAFKDAGISFSDDISGRGDGAIEWALRSVAGYLKVESPVHIFKANS